MSYTPTASDNLPSCEEDCRAPAEFSYMHQGQQHYFCGKHWRTVEHRMDAVGRIGPLVSDPVQFVPLQRPIAPEPNWREEWQESQDELTRLRHDLASLGQQHREAQGELQAAQWQIQTLERENVGLKDAIATYQRTT